MNQQAATWAWKILGPTEGYELSNDDVEAGYGRTVVVIVVAVRVRDDK